MVPSYEYKKKAFQQLLETLHQQDPDLAGYIRQHTFFDDASRRIIYTGERRVIIAVTNDREQESQSAFGQPGDPTAN